MKSLAFLSAVQVGAVSLQSETGSPVEKVVNLLKDLKAKTEADGKAEQQVYDRFACWCSNTENRKAGAIEQAKLDLRSLGQQILTHKGTVEVRTQEIANLEEAIAENLDLQDTATKLREKENASFLAETSELKQAIAALQKAVTILVKGTASSFLQGKSEVLTSTSLERNAVKDFLQVLPAKNLFPRTQSLDSHQIVLLNTFSKENSKERYAPQSETIQGILKDMYDTMTSNLEASTDGEATANRQFETLIAIKTEELGNLRDTKKTKEDEKAEAEGLLADATDTYDNTEAQMKANIKFFDATKDACQAKSDEWNVRSDLRAEEIEGIAKALEILTSDEARTLFASSIKPGTEKSFLQVSSLSSGAVLKGYQILKSSASRAHSVRLAALASRVVETKVGHFDEVLKAIDKMIVTLKEENQADIDKRDQCKEEYTKQASTISHIGWLIEKNVARIDKLQRLINKRKAEKAETIKRKEETEDHLATITKQREDDHALYLHNKAEDEAVVDLLTQARDALTAYSKKHGIDMGPIQGSVKLVQEPTFEVSADQAPDATFSKKNSRKGQTKGIVGIMQYLLEDAQNEIINDSKDEASSVAEFEKQKKAAEELIADLAKAIDDLETQIARLGEDEADEEDTMESNTKEKFDESAYLAKITPDCDWIIKNFEKRAGARAAEMEGLTGAKSFLAGAV